MIVNQIPKGWEIIYHPAHGLLAAKIAYHLQPTMFLEEYRLETIAAIQHHDDHQFSFKKENYVTEVGAPKDFTLIESTGKEVYQQVKDVTDAAFKKSCWIGSLISYHCDFLYSKQDITKELQALLESLKKKRTAVLKKKGLQKSDMLKAYDLMRFCDRLSLILCRNNIPEMHRKVEIISFQDGTRYDLWEGKKQAIHVEPWPFEMNEIEIQVEALELNDLYFSSDRTLNKALEDADVTCKKWSLKDS